MWWVSSNAHWFMFLEEGMNPRAVEIARALRGEWGGGGGRSDCFMGARWVGAHRHTLVIGSTNHRITRIFIS